MWQQRWEKWEEKWESLEGVSLPLFPSTSVWEPRGKARLRRKEGMQVALLARVSREKRNGLVWSWAKKCAMCVFTVQKREAVRLASVHLRLSQAKARWTNSPEWPKLIQKRRRQLDCQKCLQERIEEKKEWKCCSTSVKDSGWRHCWQMSISWAHNLSLPGSESWPRNWVRQSCAKLWSLLLLKLAMCQWL